MKKAVNIVLIVGFLVVDWLLFHDIFKAGETHSTTDYLTGFLSLLVFAQAGQNLLKK